MEDTMPELNDYSLLYDLYNTTVRYLGRFLVQRQLLAILVATLAAGLISALLVGWGERRYVRWCWRHRPRLYDKLGRRTWRFRTQRTAAILLQQLTFPAIAFALLLVTVSLFTRFDWLSGLIIWTISLVVLYTAYRLGIALLYILVKRRRAQRYHRRLFGPLMFVSIVLLILSRLTDLKELAQVILFPLFDNPITIGALFIATVGLYFWIDATYGVQDVMTRLIAGRTRAHAGTVEASLTILRYVLVGLGIYVAMSVLGLDPTTVAAISGGLSIGVGFALQDVLKNFFGGLVILFEGTVRPGDYVEVGGKEAVVQRLSIRSTTVRTADNVEIIVPNQDWLNRSVITYTGSSRRVRVRFTVSVPRRIEPGQVFQLLNDTVRKHPLVLEDPGPTVTVANFTGANVDYLLTVWIDDADKMSKVSSDIRLMMLHAFENADIPVA
jgi:small-conductance mechanosensitive channel